MGGIGNSVDILWTNGTEIIITSRQLDISEIINGTQLDVYPENITFTDNYTIPKLTKEENGTKYECHTIINATMLVNATGEYTVGKYQCLKQGYG